MYHGRLGQLQTTAPASAAATGESWWTQFTRGFVVAAAPTVGLRTTPAVTLTPAPVPAVVQPVTPAAAMPAWLMPALMLGGLGVTVFALTTMRRR